MRQTLMKQVWGLADSKAKIDADLSGRDSRIVNGPISTKPATMLKIVYATSKLRSGCTVPVNFYDWLFGWPGKSLPVEFDPPLREKKPCHIRLKARPVVPVISTDDGVTVIYVGTRFYNCTRIQPGEELVDYLAQMKNPDNWFISQPPIKVSAVSIRGIYFKKMPVEVKVATNKELTEQEAANTTEYRASINFSIDNDEHPVTYVLYTNPLFVTLPACRPMGGNGTQKSICESFHGSRRTHGRWEC